jgi:hypothetical protein
MNIYLLSQSVNNGYDTWDSCVVIAKDEEEARMTHPYYRYFNDDPYDEYNNWNGMGRNYDRWCNAKYVSVELIGTAVDGMERQVVCSSFNAG